MRPLGQGSSVQGIAVSLSHQNWFSPDPGAHWPFGEEGGSVAGSWLGPAWRGRRPHVRLSSQPGRDTPCSTLDGGQPSPLRGHSQQGTCRASP